jgi:hypothetical protein
VNEELINANLRTWYCSYNDGVANGIIIPTYPILAREDFAFTDQPFDAQHGSIFKPGTCALQLVCQLLGTYQAEC